VGYRTTSIDEFGEGSPPRPGRLRGGRESFELGPGGLCHVESTTPRRLWNAGDKDLVLLVVGGKDGYVERDGRLVDPRDEAHRRAVADGDLSVIRIR